MAAPKQEDPCRGRGGGDNPQGFRPVPHADHPECVRENTARLHQRHHRSWCHGGHRRVERLPGYRHARLPPRPALSTRRSGPRRGHRRSCFPACTGSRRWPNDGCCPPIKAPSKSITCPNISTSSVSGSTGADRVAAGWCSSGCCNWPSVTILSATASSSRIPCPRRRGQRPPVAGATRPAWTGPTPHARGGTHQ